MDLDFTTNFDLNFINVDMLLCASRFVYIQVAYNDVAIDSCVKLRYYETSFLKWKTID